MQKGDVFGSADSVPGTWTRLPENLIFRVRLMGQERIDDAMIENIGILSKLTLDDEGKAQAKADLSEMLGYIDRLNELDTEGVEPMVHAYSVENVFREDVITNGDGSADALANAPAVKDGMYIVPKTIGE